MSSLKSLLASGTNNFPGNLVWNLGDFPNSGFVSADGATKNQTTQSILFEQVGLNADGNVFTTWTLRSQFTTGGACNDLIYNNGLYVSVSSTGQGLRTSTDLITWTSRTPNAGTSQLNGLAFSNSLYVYVGLSGNLGTSTDAITWTRRTPGTVQNLNKVAFGNNTFVAVGNSGAVSTSNDGVTWTVRTPGTIQNLQRVVFLNNLFVVGGDNSFLSTSTDGITWTQRTLPTAFSGTVWGITYNPDAGIYLIGSSFGATGASSTDAVTWSFTPVSIVGQRTRTLIYGDGVYVVSMGDSGSRVATSTDAIVWTQRTVPSSGSINALLYNPDEKLFVAGASGTGWIAKKYSYDPATEFSVPNITPINPFDPLISSYIKEA